MGRSEWKIQVGGQGCQGWISDHFGKTNGSSNYGHLNTIDKIRTNKFYQAIFRLLDERFAESPL